MRKHHDHSWGSCSAASSMVMTTIRRRILFSFSSPSCSSLLMTTLLSLSFVFVTTIAQEDPGASIGCSPIAPAGMIEDDMLFCHTHIDEKHYPDMTNLFDSVILDDGSYEFFWSMLAHGGSGAENRRRKLLETSRASRGSNYTASTTSNSTIATSWIDHPDQDINNNELPEQRQDRSRHRRLQDNCVSWCEIYGEELCVDFFGCERPSGGSAPSGGRRSLLRSSSATTSTRGRRRMNGMTDAEIENELRKMAKNAMEGGAVDVDPVRCAGIRYSCTAKLCYSLPTIIDFILVDATTNTDIGPLEDGGTVDLSQLSGRSLSVRVETGGPVASVQFTFDGKTNFNTDNEAPFALLGHQGTDVLDVDELSKTGVKVITTTPFSEKWRRGVQGLSRTIAFTVSDMTYNLPTVTGFSLVDAATNQDIMELKDGDTFSLSSLGTNKINLRANTGGQVESVKFGYGWNSNYRIENLSPYAFGGDTFGDYYDSCDLHSIGTYFVSAKPYSGDGATGTIGARYSITYTATP